MITSDFPVLDLFNTKNICVVLIDAYSAQQLVRILLRLTKQGTTIMCTIHQPSSQLFAMFHKVLLLADGRIGFIGTPHDAVTFFSL